MMHSEIQVSPKAEEATGTAETTPAFEAIDTLDLGEKVNPGVLILDSTHPDMDAVSTRICKDKYGPEALSKIGGTIVIKKSLGEEAVADILEIFRQGREQAEAP
jgi:hypothetical protein